MATGEAKGPTRLADMEALAALGAAIPPGEILERTGPDGRTFRYIKDTTVRKRLNEVLGLDGWESELRVHPNGIVCKLTLTLPSGRRIVREGFGSYPDKQPAEKKGLTEEDRMKSGATDAFKRAGIQYGIADELYQDAQADTSYAGGGGQRPQQRGTWGGQSSSPGPGGGGGGGGGRGGPAGGGGGNFGPPKTGKALYAWAAGKGQEWVDACNEFGEQEGYAGRMVDWTPQQVRDCYSYVNSSAVDAPY